MLLADNIKFMRKQAGLTQYQLAEKIGVAQSNICSWENSIRTPLPDALIKLADFFKCSTDYLLGRESEEGNIIVSSPSTLPKSEIEQLFDFLDEGKRNLLIGYAKQLCSLQKSENELTVKKTNRRS